MGVRDWVHGVWGGAEQTGFVVASAGVPGTFEPSLVPRGVLDQALITGLSTVLSYTLTAGAQDVLEAVGSGLERWMPGASRVDRRRAATGLMDVAAIAIGVAVRRALPPRPAEPMLHGLARQAAWRVGVTGLGGIVFVLAGRGTQRLDDLLHARGRLLAVPVGLPVGLALGLVIEAHRRWLVASDDVVRRNSAPGAGPAACAGHTLVRAPAESSGMATATIMRGAAASVGVTAALSAVSFGERALADAAGSVLSARLPGGSVLWRPAGHALTLGGLAVVGTALFQRAMHRIEAGTTVIEPILDDGGRRWVGPAASGGAGSLVAWETLGREGRRHVLLYPRPQPVAGAALTDLTDLPDLSIGTVMGRPAAAEPVLIYVGLDSAPTVRERVDLALAEMDRTGAWDRSLLMLISPTGTGYVNYCATAAATYLTRGDIAMVTMQYSKRPSPLSLFKIDDAREQNRLLWLAITARLRERGASGPRVVVFGESLGAHTSQDVLLHWGTLGAQALGIDRALWVGTPHASGWMREVTGPPRPDVNPDLVAVVNDFGQLAAMTPERRHRLRYVLVSHDNDGVTKLGVDLIASRPGWLSPERPEPETVPGFSPRGIPARMRWRPLTTFLQTMIDMKNAQIPGGYRSFAHDYRPDLTRFISTVFDLPASEDEIRRIERVLEQRETVRDELLTPRAYGAEHHPVDPIR